jgi:hypothetical protein
VRDNQSECVSRLGQPRPWKSLADIVIRSSSLTSIRGYTFTTPLRCAASQVNSVLLLTLHMHERALHDLQLAPYSILIRAVPLYFIFVLSVSASLHNHIPYRGTQYSWQVGHRVTSNDHRTPKLHLQKISSKPQRSTWHI